MEIFIMDQTESSTQEFIFSASELLLQYRNALRSTWDGQLVQVEGFYSDKRGNSYGGFYYDELADKDKGEKLTIKLSADIKKNLSPGGFYCFRGFMERGKIWGSSLNIGLQVSEVSGQKKQVSKYAGADYDMVVQRMERGFADIDALLTEELMHSVKPGILIITGNESIVDEDFDRAIGQAAQLYYIRWRRLRITAAGDVIKELEALDVSGISLLAIMRGGGTGLEVFDNVDVCKAVFDLEVPFVTAIGHGVDKPLLEKFADRGFATPTALGGFLNEIASEVYSKLEHETKTTRDNQTLTMRMQQIERQHRQEKKVLYLTLAVITAILILVLILK